LKRIFSDYTEREFLEFVRRLCDFANTTESEDIKNILEFNRLTEHPAGSDLIFYPEDGQDDSPEGIVQQVKEWRKANGKPGFRDE